MCNMWIDIIFFAITSIYDILSFAVDIKEMRYSHDRTLAHQTTAES